MATTKKKVILTFTMCIFLKMNSEQLTNNYMWVPLHIKDLNNACLILGDVIEWNTNQSNFSTNNGTLT